MSEENQTPEAAPPARVRFVIEIDPATRGFGWHFEGPLRPARPDLVNALACAQALFVAEQLALMDRSGPAIQKANGPIIGLDGKIPRR